MAYDTRGRLTQITVNPGASPMVTSLGYDAAGDITSLSRPDGGSYTFQYDNARRLSAILDAANGGQIQYTRNALGGVTAAQILNSSGAVARSATATFDELNRLLSSIGAAGQTTSFSYDRTDNPTVVQDPLNNQYSYAFDALNRLISESGPLQYSVFIGYDAQDHVTTVTDPRGLVTTFVRDGFGDVISRSSPDSGATVYTYNNRGLLKRVTKPSGVVTTSTYDLLNRLTSKSYSTDASKNVAYSYDAVTNGNKGIGHLTGMTDASGSTSWNYDGSGQVISKTVTIGTQTFTTQYSYDPASGHLLSMTLPSGTVVGYSWTNSRITALTLGGSPLVSNISYKPFGAPRAWTLANGELGSRSYDLDGRITADPVETIGYDTGSRITSWTLGNRSALSGTQTYGYDALNRLIGYTGIGGPISYGYDANGNRTTQTVSGVTTSYSIDPGSNRLNSLSYPGGSTTLGYDANGSLTSKGSASLGYDAQGRLSSLNNGAISASNVYDGLGQRAQETAGTVSTVFVYDEAAHLIGEYAPNGTLTEETIYLGDMPVAVNKTLGTYYVHADYRNTPRQIDDSSTTPVWE
ncbi:MAG: hypothetical protein ACREQ5_13965, partial [Candidatus Dormibacteria bacterium]